MNADREWDGVTERRSIGDRREGSTVSVNVDGLSNGARKFAWWLLGLATTGLLAAIAWGVNTTIINVKQDDKIEQNQRSARVIDQSLSEGLAEINRTVRQVIEEQKRMQADIEQNRNGLGVLDAEKNAIRRDFERQHGNGVQP